MSFQNEASKLETPVKNQHKTIPRSKYQLLDLRRALVLFLTASLFSILVSFYTDRSFLHSSAYNFSAFLFPPFTQIFERKCMFLLCNGILVFLAGKSGLCSASCLWQEAEADDMQEIIMHADKDTILQPFTVVEPVSEEESGTCIETSASKIRIIPQVTLIREQETELLKEEQKVQDEEELQAAVATDEEVLAAEYQSGIVKRTDLAEDQGSDLEIENEDYRSVVGGAEMDAETEGPPSNTEELNKKIEEFIRKMKEELRLEAQQQQLIAA